MNKLFEWLRRRKQFYQLTFSSPAGGQVLADLAIFCRANETCFHPDARVHAVAEGRREVWLRIQQHLDLPAEQLYVLLNKRDMPNDGGNNG